MIDAEISPAQKRRRSRYERPRTYISWVGLILGILLGAGGGIYYAWNLAPVEEVNISPEQLRETDRNHYLVAIMMNYAYDGNLNRTIQELVTLDLPGNDPIQAVAVIACDLARTGYVDSNGGLNAVRSMMAFYQGQGKAGCADELLPAIDLQPTREIRGVLPTPTLRPPASKTPTPPGTIQATDTPLPAPQSTDAPQRDFELVSLRQMICSEEIAGVIEVRVVDFNSQEIPGQPIRVRWSGGQSNFVTGLKPERGQGYADFDMQPGIAYTIEMPGLSDPTSSPILADECITENGETSVKSWEVIFQGG